MLVGCWLHGSTALARPAAPPVIVHGTTACPTPGEIDTALVGLLPRDPSQAAADVLEVTSGEETGVIRLVLTNAAGEPVARRSLVAGAVDCAARARTVAVVVAAWEARMRAGAHPRIRAGDVAAGRAPAPAPAGVAVLPAPAAIADGSPGLAPAPPSPRADAPATADGAGRPADVASTSREAGAEGSWSWSAIEVETGAAFLASVAGGSVAPGASAEIALSRRASSWFSLGLGLLATGTHAAALADTDVGGRGAWRRVGGVIDLRSRSTRWRTFELDLRVGVPLTALAIRGQSLPITSGATLFDPGMLAGVRVRTRLGQVTPFLEVAGIVWPRTHTMYVGASASSTDLPAIEGWLTAGVSLVADPSRAR
jgi:hypothetical protein